MRVIIYGDLHGCFRSFIALRKKIKIKKDDVEYCVGDVISKGDDSIKVLDFLIKNGIQSTRGNHEDKILNYLSKKGKKNPINLNADEKRIVSKLTPKHIKYLKSMPIFIKHKSITILHGGLKNSMDLKNLSKKDIEQILRMRYLDKNGNFIQHFHENEHSVPWADLYKGKQGFIVYGHYARKTTYKSTHAVGIDTGCVYKNRLSAALFSNPNTPKYEIVSISCK